MSQNRGYCQINKMYLSAITFFNELSSAVTKKEILWPSTFSGISLKQFSRKEKDNFYNILVRPIGWAKECGIWLRLQEKNGDYLPCEGYMKVPKAVIIKPDKYLYFFIFDQNKKISEILTFMDEDFDAEINYGRQQMIKFEFEFVLANL